MKSDKYFLEHYIYWLAFLLAVGMRFFQLGAAPLGDAEAGWAMQALGLAHGQAVTLGAQPAYLLLTGLLFSLFRDTNFLARLFPALAGCLVVWLPFYFRRGMGDASWLHRAGLVLAFGFAIDPGLVSLSRQAGSLMPALAFTLLTLASIYNRRMVWAGIFAGLVLLSGPSFLQGLLILGVTWGLFRLAGRKPVASQPETAEPDFPVELPPAPSFRKAIPSFVLTLLVAGTLFLRVPQGLGALADTLPVFLKSWITSSGIPVLRLPASLLVYQPLVLIFALVALIRALFVNREEQLVRPIVLGLSLWVVVGILLPLLYAGRQVGDLAWALIPIWALASLEIGRSLSIEGNKTATLVAACLALLLFVLAVMGWINLLSIDREQQRLAIYVALILGAFLLGSVAVVLVAAGWSMDAARVGVMGSLCILLGLQLVSNTVGMTIVRQNGAQELWSSLPTTGQADLLLTTLSDLSSWNTGLRDQLEIVILGGPPSLEWALRHFPNARPESALASTETPAVVITLKGTEEPILAEKYRGQDFVWSLSPGWQGAFPPDFINWFAFRAAPLNESQVILWARADIFPGGVPENTSTTTP